MVAEDEVGGLLEALEVEIEVVEGEVLIGERREEARLEGEVDLSVAVHEEMAEDVVVVVVVSEDVRTRTTRTRLTYI